MSVGGNDSNVFINVITDCGAAGASTLGQGSLASQTIAALGLG